MIIDDWFPLSKGAIGDVPGEQLMLKACIGLESLAHGQHQVQIAHSSQTMQPPIETEHPQPPEH